MKRPMPVSVTPFILIAIVVAVVAGFAVFRQSESERYRRVGEVLHASSVIRLSLLKQYDRGPIAEEEERLADIDGASSVEYRVTGRNGVALRVESLPRETYEVSFFFEQTVRDGIWDLADRPPRGDTSVRYTIAVEQTVGGHSGAHRFTFTDPEYWAVRAGREYHLHLSRNGPLPNLLALQSISAAELRYRLLVTGFDTFGSSLFRERIAAARRRVSSGH